MSPVRAESAVKSCPATIMHRVTASDVIMCVLCIICKCRHVGDLPCFSSVTSNICADLSVEFLHQSTYTVCKHRKHKSFSGFCILVHYFPPPPIKYLQHGVF